MASVVPSSFMASDGAAARALNSFPKRLIIPNALFAFAIGDNGPAGALDNFVRNFEGMAYQLRALISEQNTFLAFRVR